MSKKSCQRLGDGQLLCAAHLAEMFPDRPEPETGWIVTECDMCKECHMVYCHGCGEELIGANATWHNGEAYCDGCENAPAEED